MNIDNLTDQLWHMRDSDRATKADFKAALERALVEKESYHGYSMERVTGSKLCRCGHVFSRTEVWCPKCKCNDWKWTK